MIPYRSTGTIYRWDPYRQEWGGTRITGTGPGIGGERAVLGLAGRKYGAGRIQARGGDHGSHFHRKI